MLTLVLLFVLVGPAVFVGKVLVENVMTLAENFSKGTISIPPPREGVENWPLIGEPLQKLWSLASVNIEEALQQLAPQIKVLGKWLVGAVAGAGLGLLQFVFACIIAGLLLVHAQGGYRVAYSIAHRLVGERGGEFTKLAEATVRSVATGVLGVALIQSSLAAVGFFVVGLSAAGLLTFICLVLAVVQIGVNPITIPAVIYVFSTADTFTAVMFLIWNIFVGVIDNILKPLLLGRGVNVPMVVIFIGAIGGMLLSGIIGLFLGAVILALGYKIFMAWLDEDATATELTVAEKTNV